MDARQNLKQQLPYPYDQDLSGVLRHLDRRTPLSRARLANDSVTAAYLAAAMRLIERRLGPAADRLPVDPEDPNSLERPLFKFLSQREVVAEVANNPAPFLRQGSVSTLRSLWRSQSDFVADLLNFALWPGQRPVEWGHALAAGLDKLMGGPDFAAAVHEVSFWDITALLGQPSFRFTLVAAASAQGDVSIINSFTESYRGALLPFKQLYADVMRARGMKLREGVTLDDFADILASLADGMVVRALGDHGAQIIDDHRQRSLLGKAVLAVILGSWERADDLTGRTVEDAVNILVSARSE